MILASPLPRNLIFYVGRKQGAPSRGKNSTWFSLLFNAQYQPRISLRQLVRIQRAIFGRLEATFFDRNTTSSLPEIFKICANLWPLPHLPWMDEWDITGSSDTELYSR